MTFLDVVRVILDRGREGAGITLLLGFFKDPDDIENVFILPLKSNKTER